jgi:hypothetical protein
MSAIIELPSATTGQFIYATIHDKAAKLANGATTEVFNSSNWSTYAITLAEQGTTGYYQATFPAYLAAGKYTFSFYQANNGSSAVYGDPNIGSGGIVFDGTDEEVGIEAVVLKYLLDKVAGATASGTPPTLGSFLDLIMDKNSGQTFDQTTDSLEAITDSGGGGPDAATIAAAVWDEAMIGHVTAGTAAVDLKAIVAALPGSGSISNFDPTTQTVNLGASQTGVTIGTVNAIGSSAIASVQATVELLLSSNQMVELSNAPQATPNLREAIMFMFMSMRNDHTMTSSEEKIKNNAGTVIATAQVSDDGATYTKGQFS